MTSPRTPRSRPASSSGVLPARAAVLALVLVAVLGAVGVGSAGAAPADDPMGPPSTTYSPPTDGLPGQQGTTGQQAPTGADCGPGNILRYPNCGQEPASKDDPGGWLQVSLFFLVCAAILAIGAAVAWRARAARQRRRDAGLDPLQLARARGEGVRHPPSTSA